MSPWSLIKTDLIRHEGQYKLSLFFKNLINSNRSFKYTFWLRLRHHKNLIVRAVAKVMHHQLSAAYQIQIPKEVQIGKGLYLGHAVGVVVNASARIGDNCNISQFVTIGSNHGKAAVVGNDVYIGPNVCLVENVVIGDVVTIGAGSVVVCDIPPNSTAVGNPAHHFKSKNPGMYIMNRAF